MVVLDNPRVDGARASERIDAPASKGASDCLPRAINSVHVMFSQGIVEEDDEDDDDDDDHDDDDDDDDGSMKTRRSRARMPSINIFSSGFPSAEDD